MFKKEPQIKALSNLKNSERKNIQSQCKEQTGSSEYAFPSQVIKQTTFKTPFTTGTVFTDQKNVPIWFKEKFSDLLYPTVFTCWSNSKLLPIVLAHEYVVEEKLLKGANLMLPGTVPPFDERCVKTRMVSVASTAAPDVVKAIGIVQINLPQYSRVIGESGVAVEIVHTFGDELCKVFKVKLQPPEGSAAILDSESEEEADIEDDTGVPSAPESLAAPKSLQDVQEPLVNVEDISEQLTELRVEDVDHFFTRSLYYSLAHDAKLETPISASNFVSNHILRNLPPIDHTQVNMKKTSWKKTAKFLKYFEKEGFLKLKGKGDDLTIIGVDRTKSELKNFAPYRIGGGASSSEKGASSVANEKEQASVMKAVSLYRPISSTKAFLSATDLPPNQMFTQQDIKSAVDKYISAKNLVSPDNKSAVRLDDLLYDLVNRSSKKENAVRTIARAQIMAPVLKGNFSEHFLILKADGTPLFKHPVKGSIPQVQIVTEMKIGRKVVTKVSNFEKFQVDADELAEALRKKCSGSTTIGEANTSPKTLEVTVQGPHGPAVIELLNESGIPTKWINFVNKLKKNKKRK
ncbi:Tma64p [Lachancea thermotolerans CBS 6340]|uniref:KLTH0G13530p n=1 Tax=Lachancea thermotolerans (strain ATCC 56472 / CBS 6340 / NRRL Y-8284) TaxID=559295 RepID=C5DN22_LACTC|nr:KLTH0G13530p [Lachancea thermotolerans CBS 6340]CAR25183.1 KLTH0G13530p [Lachancea thermotolerans CBS 6340]